MGKVETVMKAKPSATNPMLTAFEIAVSVEVNILLCSLRGGFTTEAVNSFRDLGALLQDHPESEGAAAVRLMTRDDAVEFLQLLSAAQEATDDV